jgi:osmoprotectant transport system permease protein
MLPTLRPQHAILAVIGLVVATAPTIVQATGLAQQLLGFRLEVQYLLVQHLRLVGSAAFFSIALGIPIGVWLSRKGMRRHAEVIMQVLNIGTTVPTLAKLAIAMLFFGIGTGSAVIGLTIAILMPIARNTCAGLLAVNPYLLDAARGMGMRDSQILWRVEFPNALNVIVTGVRIAVTYATGTAALAFLIGGGGLGELIFTGIDINEPAMMLAGAITTCLLAVLVDLLLYQIQYWVIPRGVNPYRPLRS